MNKKLILLNLTIYISIISFSTLPKETESYHRNNRVCRMVRKKVREIEECNIDYLDCIVTPVYEDVEECHTETEWVERETGKYLIDEVKPIMNEYAKRKEEEIKAKSPTFIDKLKGWFNGTSGEEVRDARAKSIGDELRKVIEEDAKNNGTDIRDNPSIFDSTTGKIVKNYSDIEKNIDEIKANAINKSANSKVVREYHRRYNSVDKSAKLYLNNLAYDPYAEPIKIEDERNITDEMRRSGKPIFIIPKVETEVDEEDDEPIYKYYNLEYNANGADSGIVPITENKRENTYVKVADNYGNLIKDGYKFVGWNTYSNGKGTTYKAFENIRLNMNITLYAKWEKINKIDEAPIPITPSELNKYSISFVANEYSRLEGKANFLIDENSAINNTPEVIVDKGYIFKGFKDNNGIIRTKEEVINLIPTSNISFVVITEKDPNSKITIPMISLEPSIHTGKPNLIYNEIEVYVGDKVNIEDVISYNNIEIDGYIKMWIRKPDTSLVGKASGTIKMYDSKNQVGWDDFPEINTITVIAKPNLVYKNKRIKNINSTITFEDVVSNELDDRYEIRVINDIDVNTVGTKVVELSIIDNKTGRVFNGFNTDITLVEDMDEIIWKDNPNIYVGDGTNVDDLIDYTNIPNKYQIIIKNPADSSSVGENKPVIIKINNPNTGGTWEIIKYIEVIPEPELVGNLWIYQNYKNPDEKGMEFLNKITVNLNEKYFERYEVFFVSSNDVSVLGDTNFTYKIKDTWKNREFIKTIKVEVVEENINPIINQNLEFYIGHIISEDEIISGVDKENYNIEIVNKEEIDQGRFTIGTKVLKIRIISKDTGKIWEYDVNVTYINKNIDLGILYWEKGEKLTLEDIKKYKDIEEETILELLSGEIKTNIVEEYELELKVIYKDGAYVIARLKVSIVENNSIIDINKINESNKIHMITQIDEVSSKLNKTLNKMNFFSKARGLWLEQTNSFYKYINSNNSNKSGFKIGYDSIFLNNNITGLYFGYDNIKYKLSDYSKQNMIHFGIYTGQILKTNKNKKYYLGIVGQYSSIFGSINVKNVNNEKIKYESSSHNILINGFLGAKKHIDNNIEISFNIGNTIIYQFNSKFNNFKNNIKHNNNITNEVYSELMLNKKYNKFNFYTIAKIGYLYGKNKYILNGIVYDFNLKRLDIYGKFGIDYSITKNSNLLLETYIKNQYNMYKFNGGTKINYEYRW